MIYRYLRMKTRLIKIERNNKFKKNRWNQNKDINEVNVHFNGDMHTL